MKILITTGIFPPDIGGPATYVYNLADFLSKNNDVLILTAGDKHISKNYGYKIKRVPKKLKWPLYYPLVFLNALFLGRKYDVIYVNGLELPVVFANKFLKKPLVMKIVSDSAWERARLKNLTKDGFEEFQRKKYGIRIEFFKKIRNFCVRNANKVIVPSNYLRNEVSNWGVDKNKIEIINNCAFTNKFTNKQTGLKNKEKIILTAGRLVNWKGFEGLIKVMENIDAKLLIIGDGPEKAKLMGLAENKNLHNKVKFLGKLPNEKLLSYLKSADIFVLNSEYEGMSHLILEAMAAGTPVIAADVGGNKELIENGYNGFLCSYGDYEKLEFSIKRLLGDEKLQKKFRKNSLEKIKMFDYKHNLKKTAEILAKP